jgi:hypothetical protein
VKKNIAIFKVTPQQVGSSDLQQFLREQIHKQFAGKEYYISNEEIMESATHYSKTPRKLRGFMINENGVGHAIWFDVTEIIPFNWAPDR